VTVEIFMGAVTAWDMEPHAFTFGGLFPMV
jgi:hypothetical protein